MRDSEIVHQAPFISSVFISLKLHENACLKFSILWVGILLEKTLRQTAPQQKEEWQALLLEGHCNRRALCFAGWLKGKEFGKSHSGTQCSSSLTESFDAWSGVWVGIEEKQKHLREGRWCLALNTKLCFPLRPWRLERQQMVEKLVNYTDFFFFPAVSLRLHIIKQGWERGRASLLDYSRVFVIV